MAKTKTWELPHGPGQGPKPNPNLPPQKLAKKKKTVNINIWDKA